MQADAFDAEALAALLEFRGPVGGADDVEVGEEGIGSREEAQNGFDVGAESDEAPCNHEARCSVFNRK
jgi:hypothetical protein